MDITALSLLAEYNDRKIIQWQTVRDEIAADEMYSDLADNQRGVERVFAEMNQFLVDNNYIERAGLSASGIGPETYQITAQGVAALNAEVEIIKKNRSEKPMQDIVNDAIKEAEKMLGVPLIPREEKKSRVPLFLGILLGVIVVAFVIDFFTGRHLLHLFMGKG